MADCGGPPPAAGQIVASFFAGAAAAAGPTPRALQQEAMRERRQGLGMRRRSRSGRPVCGSVLRGRRDMVAEWVATLGGFVILGCPMSEEAVAATYECGRE